MTGDEQQKPTAKKLKDLGNQVESGALDLYDALRSAYLLGVERTLEVKREVEQEVQNGQR